MAALVLDAIAASLLDVLVGLVVVTLLALVIAVVARSERAATEVEPEPEVIEAFSQFPDRNAWRRETHSDGRWDRAA